MTSAEQVLDCLFSFCQHAFKRKAGKVQNQYVNRSLDNELFSWLANCPELTTSEIKQLNREKQVWLYHLLTQYIAFMTMFPDLTFPDFFLHGSSRKRLQQPLLEYLASNQWPSPQQVPDQSLSTVH